MFECEIVSMLVPSYCSVNVGMLKSHAHYCVITTELDVHDQLAWNLGIRIHILFMHTYPKYEAKRLSIALHYGAVCMQSYRFVGLE